MSGQWKTVERRTFAPFEKFGAPPTVLVRYYCTPDGEPSQDCFKEWVSIEKPTARRWVERWWRINGGLDPAPLTMNEALGRVGELRAVEAIRVEPEGKFWFITGRRFANTREVGNLALGSTNQRAD